MSKKSNKNVKFIFVTGGVVSSLGKGLASAALASTLQSRGFKVRIRKLDPYLNVDPGTMSPYQHGEVFVTDDGGETDLDLGHYERFTGVSAQKTDNITTGKIYSTVISKERRGEYLGATVQVIPHITDEIKAFISGGLTDEDFVICEIGGTVGDIEAQPFLEAIRQFRNEVGAARTLFLHLTLLPYIPTAGELKTKPTQHSVKELLSVGIQANILLCRCDRPIPDKERSKIALFCNIAPENVIAARDANCLYEVPISYHERGLDKAVLKYFNIPLKKSANMKVWKDIVDRYNNPEKQVRIAVVGKYTAMLDCYKSIHEALIHAGLTHHAKIDFDWVEASDLTSETINERLELANGILVPGGFGERGIAGKLLAIQYAREKNVPYFGICLGMQLAVIEFARHVLNLEDAHSSEMVTGSQNAIVGLMTEWEKAGTKQKRGKDGDLGGTMRLGAYPATLAPDSLAHQAYKTAEISERHRHRYEVNMSYRDALEKAGMVMTGVSPDGLLPEIVEIKAHPWFVATQFHPEFKSRPFAPHPLFENFIKASLKFESLL